MAHRRRYRRARKNPVSDNTKIVIAVGVTALIAGVGLYLYKRQPTTTDNKRGDKQLPGGDTAAKAAALTAARNKFASLIGADPNGTVYAFQMAIGAVQALGIAPEDVIGIAWAAVAAYYSGTGVPLARAQEWATLIRDESGFGPLGAEGARQFAEGIRKAKYGNGPALDSP